MQSFFHGRTDVDTDDVSSDAADAAYLDDAEAASRDGHDVSRKGHLSSVWPEALSRFASTTDVETDHQNARVFQTFSSIPAKRDRGIHLLAGSQHGISSLEPRPRSGVGSIPGNGTWGVDVAPDGGAPPADVFNLPTLYEWDPEFAGLGWND